MNFDTNSISLKEEIENKEMAITRACEILVSNGVVTDEYLEGMFKRENQISTFMGNFVAIPHGTEEYKKCILKSGISVITTSNDVDFGDGNIVRVIIGIAGKGDDHMQILSKLAVFLIEEENVHKLLNSDSKKDVIEMIMEAQ